MIKAKGGKFLIVGGASLVGAYLADELLAQGASEIRLFDNFATGAQSMIAHLENEPRVKFIRGDALRLNEVMDASAGVEGVFALASFLTSGIAVNPQLGVNVNTTGMLNVMEACRFAGVKRVVYSSSVATYGEAVAHPITESSGYFGSTMQSTIQIYAATKLLGEALCKHYARIYGLEYNVVRIASAFGARQHARALNSTFLAGVCLQVMRGEAPTIQGDGAEVHDYIYVSDVAKACLLAMTSQENGHILNVATGVDTTSTRVAEIVLKLCNRPDLKPQYLEDKRAVKPASTTRLLFDRSKAESLIGWKPEVSVEEGIRRLLDWLKAEQA